MATHELDCLGLKCPQPILKVVAKIPTIPAGDVLEIKADCPSFPKDIEAWCERTGKALMFCMDDGSGVHTAQIQL